jgi:DNA invertase Pin-like site-specific DNA recombinase
VNVVALCRVSTDLQANRGASLDAQERRIRELAASCGWTLVEVFRGHESAAKAAAERQMLERVLACIRERDVQALWVYELSRFTRGDELEVALLVRELREREVRLIVGTTEHDLTDAATTFSFGVQSLVSRHEWNVLRERTNRGRREKALQGKRIAGKAPYGYRNPPLGDPRHGILQVHAEEAGVVRRIFRAAEAGTGPVAIAEQLNREGIPSPRGGRWNRNTLYLMLDNRTYAGIAEGSVWQRANGKTYRRDRENTRAVVVEGAHEAIVTAAEYEAARRMVSGLRSTGKPTLLTGLLYLDGKRAYSDPCRGGERRYRPTGGGPGVPAAIVNDLVWRGFLGIATRPQALAALYRHAAGQGNGEDPAADIAVLEARQARLRARLARLITMRADGEIDKAGFAERKAEAEGQIRSLDQQLAAAKRQRDEAHDAPRQDRELALQAALVAKLAPEQRRNILRRLVARVDVSLAAVEPRRQTRQGKLTARRYPQWHPEQIVLRLVAPASCTSPVQSSCESRADLGHQWVTVQVVADGALLEPAEALRRALREAA